jgi:hypothetical protein
MWLFTTEPTNEFTDGLKIYSEGIKGLYDAAKSALIPEDNIEILTSMESKAKSIQRSISGIQISPESANAFREKIEDIYFGTKKLRGGILEINGTVKDITDGIQGMYESLGRVIEPSSKVLTSMVEMSKATGISALEIGKMTGEFMKLTFSQEKSISLINKITTDARKSGLDVKGVLIEVQKNLSKVNAYNFKGGVDGLTKMVLEAKRLGVTIDDIGAASLGRSFAFDPEKAIEAASSMSMLGGSMSDLMNPFQLMNMGANNVGKLQSNLVEMSKSAFKVNEATGEIETNAIAQQRLYEQLKSFGKEGEYEKFINMGRESAKQAMIVKEVSKSGLGNLFGEGKMFDEKQQGLISQLSEIGPGGKITLDLPGVGNISDLSTELKNNPERIQSALTKYNDMAQKSDKDIAISNLTITEDQAKDTKIIKESILSQYTSDQRTKILENVEKAMSVSQEGAIKVSNELGAATKLGIDNIVANATTTSKNIQKEFGIGNADLTIQTAVIKVLSEKNQNTTVNPQNDAFFGGETKTLSTGKGEMFSFIKEDQAVFAPDLDKKLGVLKASYMKMKDFENSALSQIVPKELPEVKLPRTESTQKTEVTETKVQKIEGSGSVNINVNITSSGNLADTLINDRRFKNDLEKEILYVIKNKDLLMVKKP